MLGGTSTPHRHRPGQLIDEHYERGVRVRTFLCEEPSCREKIVR